MTLIRYKGVKDKSGSGSPNRRAGIDWALQKSFPFLLPSENAWSHFWQHVYRFLDIPEKSYRDQLQSAATSSILTRFAELSLRERDVLHLVAQGYRNDEIAAALVLTPKTVRNYISRIFAKLDVSSRGEAIVLAKNAGFGELKPR